MGRRNNPPQAEPAWKAARIGVLSDFFNRRVERLARSVPKPPPPTVWRDVPGENPAHVREADLTSDELKANSAELKIPSVQIHGRLAEYHRHKRAKRWLAAKAALEAAEELARPHWPAIHAARQRIRLEELEKKQAEREMRLRTTLPQSGNEAKRRKADKLARRYVKAANELRKRHETWALTRVAGHLAEPGPNFPRPRSARQIIRYLRAAGLS